MTLLQSLRNARSLTRLVLVWLALFMGVAVASPLVNPEGVQWICTSTGSVKLVHFDADGQETQGSDQGVHCPLCLPSSALPMVFAQEPAPVGQSCVLCPAELVWRACPASQPWQARAPPVLS